MKVIINVRHGSKVVSSTKINTESQAAIFHTPPKMPLQVEFLDQISGLAAEIKETHRNGFDLEITFAGSDQADVIFKDYYTLSELEVPELVGHSEDGRFYSYKFRLKNSGKGNVGSEGAIASEVAVATATEVAKSVFSPLVVAGAGLATAAVAAVGVSHVRKQSSNNTGNSNSNDNSNNQDTGSNSGNDNGKNQDTSNNSSNNNSNNQDTGNNSSNDNGKNQDTSNNSSNDNGKNQDTGSNSGNDTSNNQDTGSNSGNGNSNNQDTGNNSGNDNSNNQDTGSNSGNSGSNDSRQAGDNDNSFTKLVLRLQEDTGTSSSDNYTKNPNIILQGVPKGEHYEYSIDGGYSWTSVENSTDSEIILRLPDNGKSNGQRHIVKARIANKAGIYDADPIVVTYDHVIHSRIGFGSSDGVFIGIGEVGSQNRLLDEFGAFLGEHAIIRGERTFEESIRIVAENSPKHDSSENSWDIRYMLETKDLAGNEAVQRFTQYTAFTLNNESRHNDITTLMGKESLHKSDSLYIDEHFYRYRENSLNYSELKDTGTNSGLQFQDGDDVLIYYRNFIENSRIDMGAGHDFIYAHGALADEAQPVSLFMGEGEDVLLFNAPLYFSSTYMHSGLSIDLGEGDDKFMLLGGSSIDVAKVNASGSGKLVGGAGIDTLVLMFIPSNDLASIGQWEGISGFEKIEIRGAFHVNDLSIDVLRKNHNSLVISDDGKQHSGVFIIEGSSTDRVSFSKSSIAEAKGESVEYAGTRYDTYHYNSGNEHYEVWVQQGIVVI